MLLDRLISPEEQTGLRKSRTLARAGKFYRLKAKGDDVSALSGACAQVWSRAEHLDRDLVGWQHQGSGFQELPRMQNWAVRAIPLFGVFQCRWLLGKEGRLEFEACAGLSRGPRLTV